MMIETANNAKKTISKDMVAMKKNLNIKDLKEQFDLLRAAVMISYPGYFGLPAWEPVRILLEDKKALEGRETDVGEVFLLSIIISGC